MRVFNLLLLISMFIPFPLPAQVGERYIEVTGTSEIEVVPDRIHYVIEIREYFEEEFDGVSKPEEYRTKVPLTRIEVELKVGFENSRSATGGNPHKGCGR